MTTLKIDTIVFTNNSVDATIELSGIVNQATYDATTGVINPVTKNVNTTGEISGYVYKTSGNVTIISDSGNVRPYGLFSFPASVGASGYFLTTDANGSTSWSAVAPGLTTAFCIALNKC